MLLNCPSEKLHQFLLPLAIYENAQFPVNLWYHFKSANLIRKILIFVVLIYQEITQTVQVVF